MFFFSRFTRSTNMSNEISRMRVTAKKTWQQEQTFFCLNALFFLCASVSSLLNIEFMVVTIVDTRLEYNL